MTPNEFLANFGQIAAAPNGIERVRALVLVLAMRGDLSSPEAGDGTVDDILAKIEVAKEELRAQDIRLPRQLPDPSHGEVPNLIPPHWRWVRFGNIARHNSGKTLDKQRNRGQSRGYITTSNLYWGRFVLDDLRQMLIRDEELERCTARKGDLLICEGGEAGRAAVWTSDEEVCFQNHIHRARFYYGVTPFFAYRFFEKLNATGEINQHRKGVGISNLSGKALASIAFPLPPVPEQDRIVAKIDALMALCDGLEKKQQERAELRPRLAKAAHDRFSETPTIENLKTCFADSGYANPTELRKTVLALAVQGKLAEQDERDGPVHDLLTKIAQEKEALNEGRKRRGNARIRISESAGAWNIPASWQWVRFGDLMINRDGERIPVSKTERSRRAKKYDYYGASGVIDKIDDYLFDKPLLLIGEDGANLINRSTPIAFIARGKYWVNNHAHVLDSVSEDVLRYVELHINAIDLRPYVTGTAQPKMNQAKMNSILLAVPPLAEQRRIIAKVETLIALVYKLEQQQTAHETLATGFTKSAIAALTGAKIEPPERMKTPKTELVSNVRLRVGPNDTKNAPLSELLAKNNGEMPARTLWQRSQFSDDIEGFYQQLRTEVSAGWINEPTGEEATMKVLS